MDHKTVYQKVVCNMDQMGGRMVMRRWKLFILIVIGMIIIGGFSNKKWKVDFTGREKRIFCSRII